LIIEKIKKLILEFESMLSSEEKLTNPWVEKRLARIKALITDAETKQRFLDECKRHLPLACLAAFYLLLPQLGFCSVESSLTAIQAKLIGTILPLVAILGLVMAGLSFVIGSPNARAHLVLAVIGCLVGFGAQSIVAFLRGLVN
jgi:type IV secretory pathway VirB2 component (pilin)